MRFLSIPPIEAVMVWVILTSVTLGGTLLIVFASFCIEANSKESALVLDNQVAKMQHLRNLRNLHRKKP